MALLGVTAAIGAWRYRYLPPTAQGEQIVPLVGARRRDRLTESLAAVDLVLDQDALDEIERAVPAGAASGQRYATASMALLDSEK
ncbi:hypothetical protein KBX71_03325 [Micromonospora sp. D93]|uniref:hypothetical protein n=1 Tax=Micromonospora sp. D93 TaxID=2824886 RepID=UPI001B3738FF|nr:hypothetical protein [Micromonospora sp. D93]MBQ1016892.1 hypothetical protein [Micromonospora sp. D93]